MVYNGLSMNIILPVAQVKPSHPVTQVQAQPLTLSTHVAPFIHGLDAHSSVSEIKTQGFNIRPTGLIDS